MYRSLFLVFVLLGCESQEYEEQNLACIDMTRNKCMNSSMCTLEGTDTDLIYSCRESTGICEEGIVQSDITGSTEGNTDCRTTENCEITGGECYCGCPGYGQTAVEDEADLEECTCMCGGEEPSSCTPVE
jgi:hypothetical protein